MSTTVRRRAGGALVAAGLLLVTFAGTRYVGGELEARERRERFEAAEARAIVAGIRDGSTFSVLAAERSVIGAPVARLRIPRLGLDEIVVEGVGDEELNVGPGHLPGSPLPGERGNSVISAHRDRHFHTLGRLVPGDTIVTDIGPKRTTWVVVARRVVEADAPALFNTKQSTLTLTTCWPIRYFGPAPERLIVTARPIGSRERA